MSPLHRRLPFVLLAVVYAALVTSSSPAAEPGAGLSPLQFPQIEKYGSVVALPDAGRQAESGA